MSEIYPTIRPKDWKSSQAHIFQSFYALMLRPLLQEPGFVSVTLCLAHKVNVACCVDFL